MEIMNRIVLYSYQSQPEAPDSENPVLILAVLEAALPGPGEQCTRTSVIILPPRGPLVARV